MKDKEKQFEDFIHDIKFDDTPDPEHRDKLEQDLVAAFHKQPRQINIWRIIMKSKMTRHAAVAAAVIIAVFLGIGYFSRFDGTTVAYAITDAPGVLQKARIIHIKGMSYEEAICKNGKRISLSPAVFEFWYDIENGRNRTKSVGHSIDSYNCTYEERFSESIFDGQYTLEIDHHTKEAEYFLLSPFCKQIAKHLFSNDVNFYLFGDLFQLRNSIIIDRELIDNIEYDVWQGEIINRETGTQEIWKYWVSPDTGKLGRTQTWRREDDSFWKLSSEIVKIEYNIDVSDEMFEAMPPAGYKLVNTKETAQVQYLDDQEQGIKADATTCNGEFWIWIDEKIGFTLDNGSVILGWSSSSSNLKVPQSEIFDALYPGGPLPKLPMEISNLKATSYEGEILYTGRHLAYTKKGDGFYEWSIYVPVTKPKTRSEIIRYSAPCNLNVDLPGPDDYNCPEYSMVDLDGLKSADLFMFDDILIESAEDFNKWVLGAMAELSDQGTAPQGLTYESVLDLTEQIRESMDK
jgi:hypothetical protein